MGGQTLEQMLILKDLKQSYGHYYVLETCKTVGGMGADTKGIQEESTSQPTLEDWALQRDVRQELQDEEQKQEVWESRVPVCSGNRKPLNAGLKGERSKQ